MHWDNGDRRDTVALPVQEFSCSLLYHLFHQLQPIIGQIIPGVFPEAEGKKMAQTFFLGRGKHLFCRTDIVIINAGQKRIRIVLQRFSEERSSEPAKLNSALP